MFKSIIEQLENICESPGENPTDILIAKYLLSCWEQGIRPTSQECAEKCFTSKSVLTAFAKRYGYDGFKEIVIRIRVEDEYYRNQLDPRNPITKTQHSSYYHFIEQELKNLETQDEMLNLLVKKIEGADNIYFFASYSQQLGMQIFASDLQLLGFSVFFTFHRMSEPGYIKNANKNDLAIIYASGVDNRYLINHYNALKSKGIPIFLLTTKSQRHKFAANDNTILIDFSDRSNLSNTAKTVMSQYVFSHIVYKLQSWGKLKNC